MKESIQNLLARFLEQGYQTSFFSEVGKQSSSPQLFLRHDIDFCLESAYKMAVIEHQMSMHATYFFLLSGFAYNPFTKYGRGIIREIQKMGHRISIHFDPEVYEDMEAGCQFELRLFREAFGVDCEIISIHRPNAFFLEGDRTLNGIDHTYLSKYRGGIFYVADSRGEFRYGHPCNSVAFNTNQSIQMLLHPIWWFYDGENAVEKIQSFFENHVDFYQQDIGRNCIPYQLYLDQKSCQDPNRSVSLS